MAKLLSILFLRPSVLLCAGILFVSGCATAPVGGMASVQATKLLFKADHANDSRAIGLYLDAARNGLALATDRNSPPELRAQGEQIYNAAMAKCAVALHKQRLLPEGKAEAIFRGASSTYKLCVVSRGGSENPAKFDRLLDASKVFRKHLKENIVRDGFGGALVGVSNSPENVPNRAPGGFATPVTVVGDFGTPGKGGEIPVDLFFYNPQMKEKVTLEHLIYPLKGDFTAPLAYFPRTRPLIFGIVAMMRSDRAAGRSGIFFMEPFDSQKIPILFVHGLMSSPHAWVNFINDLDRDPEFRRRYQPWVLFYPSGGPIAGNAMRLRKQLADIAKNYPLKNNLVIVGHSMGGILTQMQVTNSDRILWDTVFSKNPDTVYNMFPDTSMLKRALIFEANPHVSRVIFIATPHLGSRLADLRISSLVGSLIRMPSEFIKNFNPETRAVLHQISPSIRSLPNSIIGLSPESPLLKGVAKLEITVPYHSIIGNQGKDNEPLAQSSDGIVPYWSSHLKGAQSEIIVPTGHDAFDNPASVTEVLRILALKK